MRRLFTMLAIALFAVSTVAATGCGGDAKKGDEKATSSSTDAGGDEKAGSDAKEGEGEG